MNSYVIDVTPEIGGEIWDGRCRILAACHDGNRETLIFLPDYHVYLPTDFDGTNVYDPYENLLGHYDTEEEARKAVALRTGLKVFTATTFCGIIFIEGFLKRYDIADGYAFVVSISVSFAVTILLFAILLEHNERTLSQLNKGTGN